MKLEINLKIILIGLLFFVLKQIDIYVIFIIFITLHEIAHLVVGMICGLKPKVFAINPLGVSLEFYIYKSKKSIRKIITYFAGPIFNLLVALILIPFSFDEDLKMKIVYTNLLLAIFNLIPIMPLDGGKIMKEILVKCWGNKDATIFMNKLTKAILCFMTIFYSIAILKLKNFAIFLLILYLWYLKYIEDKKVRLMVKAYEVIEKN